MSFEEEIVILRSKNEDQIIVQLQKWVKKAPDENCADLIPEIQTLIQSKSIGIRFWAKKVANILGQTNVPKLIADTSSPNVVTAPMSAPNEQGSIKILLKKLDSIDSTFVALDLIKRLCETRDPEVEEALINHLQKCSDVVQISSLTKCLGIYFPSEKMLQVLLPFLKHNDDRVVANTIEGIEAIDSIAGPVLFTQLLEHPANRVRANASKALCKSDPEKTFQILEQMLRSKDKPHFAISACHAVKILKNPRYLPMLLELLPQDLLFESVFAAISAIGRKPAKELLSSVPKESIGEEKWERIQNWLNQPIDDVPEKNSEGTSTSEDSKGLAKDKVVEAFSSLGISVKKLLGVAYNAGCSLVRQESAPGIWEKRYLRVFGALIFLPPLGWFGLLHSLRFSRKNKWKLFGGSAVWTLFVLILLFRAQFGSDKPTSTPVAYKNSSSEDFATNYQKDRETLSVYLSQGGDPNLILPNGDSLLHDAIKRQDTSAINYLLIKKADLKIKNRQGETPLHLAAKQNYYAVDDLLRAGADPNEVVASDTTVFVIAFEKDKRNLAVFLSFGGNPNAIMPNGDSLLHYSIKHQNTDSIATLLKKKADINIKNRQGETPLHLAVKGNNYAIDSLLRAGADPNEVVASETTVFTLAYEKDRKNIFTFLNFGGNPNLILPNGDSLLHDSIKQHDTYSIAALLKKKADPNITNLQGEAPLHLAVKEDCCSVSDFVENGANPNIQNDKGETPLHIIVRKNPGNLRAASLLFEKGANPGIKDIDGISPNDCVASISDPSLFAIFRKSGARIVSKTNLPSFISYQRSKNKKEMQELLKDGVDINAFTNSDNLNPLKLAIQEKDLEMVNFLLENGADPNATTHSNHLTSPFYFAIKSGEPKILGILESAGGVVASDTATKLLLDLVMAKRLENVQLVLKFGADPNVVDSRANTALHHCAENGSVEIARALLENKARPDLLNNDGDAPIHVAVRKNNLQVLKILSEHHANIDLPDKKGKTPLHSAAEAGKIEFVQQLLADKAAVNLQDLENRTPMDLVCQNYRLDINEKTLLVEMFKKAGSNQKNPLLAPHLWAAAKKGDVKKLQELLQAGAEINSQNDSKETALHIAAQSGQLEAVKYLLSQGSRVDIPDDKGRNPATSASENMKREVFDFLVQNGAKGVNYFLKDDLVAAVKAGNDVEVARLLDQGAFTGIELDNGCPLLIFAINNGKEQIARQLIQSGAKTDVKTKDGQTVLDAAISGGSSDFIDFIARQDQTKSRRKPVDLIEDVLSKDNLDGLNYLFKQELKLSFANNTGETILHRACIWGALKCYKHLINLGLDFKAKDSFGQTCLHKAASSNNIEICKDLLLKGADLQAEAVSLIPGLVDSKWKNGVGGVTPLFCAISGSASSTVTFLLERGADLNSRDTNGNTLLHWAVFNLLAGEQNLECIKILIAAGANGDIPNESGLTAFDFVAEFRSVKIAKLLLKNGVLLNKHRKFGVLSPTDRAHSRRRESMYPFLDWIDKYDAKLPLHFAVVSGARKQLEESVSFGLDVNSTDDSGFTPLHLAALLDLPEVITFLLANGANINALAENQITPLLVAVYEENFDAVSLLLKKGASANICSGDNDNYRIKCFSCSPLRLTVSRKNYPLFKLLIAHGADPNDETLNKPIHTAVHSGIASFVYDLLEKKADANAVGFRGRTAIFYAIERHTDFLFRQKRESFNPEVEVKASPFPDFVLKLLKYGANVNFCDPEGKTPLWIAVESGDEKMVQLLLDHGGDPKISHDERGRTPLHCAVANKNVNIVRQLIGKGANANAKDENGESPYALAKRIQAYAIFEELKTKGGEATSSMIESDFRIAIDSGNLELLAKIVKGGFDINSLNPEGNAPIHQAILKGDLPIVKYLLEQGVALEKKNSEQLTPLMLAAAKGHKGIVVLLLKNGANANADCEDSRLFPRFPLHFAIASNNLPIAEALLKAGAEADKKSQGVTSLQFIATSDACLELARLFLKCGANINAHGPNPKGETLLTPLFAAVMNGQLEMVKLLVENGADFKSTEVNGVSALGLAAIKEHELIVGFLLKSGATLKETPKARITHERILKMLEKAGQ
ncbi:MAG: ankyrin repeat domain-containing protein [Candidatus Riflebacteria bacterium]|nr:ankyrin repeat domain-containing protein [Candidatus Riflebacteria bacterium]